MSAIRVSSLDASVNANSARLVPAVPHANRNKPAAPQASPLSDTGERSHQNRVPARGGDERTIEDPEFTDRGAP
jgi:hypothetical protein